METLSRIIGNHVRLFRDGDATADVVETESRARADDLATIVTATDHGLSTGDTVTIQGLGGVGYNDNDVEVTVVSADTFTYANEGDDEATAPDDNGTVTIDSTASRSKRPAAADPGWIDVGIVLDLSFDRTMTADQIMAPNPGKRELYDVIETAVVNGCKFTAEQLSPVLVEVLFGTAALDADSTTYTPNAKITKKFWVEVKQYDQDDNLINTVYLYCYVKLDGEVKFGDKHVTGNFSCQKLVSTLNAGTLA